MDLNATNVWQKERRYCEAQSNRSDLSAIGYGQFRRQVLKHGIGHSHISLQHFQNQWDLFYEAWLKNLLRFFSIFV
jgi:hypothetical protein